jgi:hypothetical protein
LVSFPHSQFYHSSKRDDKGLIEALQGLAFKKPFLRLEAAFCLPQKVWQVLEPQEGLQSLQASKTEQEAKSEAQTPCQSKTTIDSAGANKQQLEHGFYE